jgi:hypothetical protein
MVNGERRKKERKRGDGEKERLSEGAGKRDSHETLKRLFVTFLNTGGTCRRSRNAASLGPWIAY